MTLDDLDRLLDQYEQTATALLARDGHHAPMVLVVAPHGTATLPIALLHFDDATKDLLRALLDTLARTGAAAFVLITEAWGTTSPQAEAWLAMGRRLASFADRQECLVLSGACPAGQRIRVRPILRAGGEVRAGAPLPLPGDGTISNRLFDNLPWAAPGPRAEEDGHAPL